MSMASGCELQVAVVFRGEEGRFLTTEHTEYTDGEEREFFNR